MRFPEVDIAACNLCGGCVELAPTVFFLNEEFGYIEVRENDAYPEAEVDEAIKDCPTDAISWADG